LFFHFGKKRNKANRAVFIPIKIRIILGSAPPYSSKILLPEATYRNNAVNNPKIIYPEGLLYFELETKIRYSQRKIPAIIKTKKSDTNPKVKILKLSKAVKELCVIG